MLYFAYGSNMSLARLRARAPCARRIISCALHGYELRFHKLGQDGSGKCDAYKTASVDALVQGALFEISVAEKASLDRAEGLGRGYNEIWVQVTSEAGELFDAVTYYATSLDETLKPYSWYLNHVLTGARESSLPGSYIALIEAIETIEDPDLERDKRERGLHG